MFNRFLIEFYWNITNLFNGIKQIDFYNLGEAPCCFSKMCGPQNCCFIIVLPQTIILCLDQHVADSIKVFFHRNVKLSPQPAKLGAKFPSAWALEYNYITFDNTL